MGGKGSGGTPPRFRGLKAKYPHGIPAGTKTPAGWLLDDGGQPDMVAVYIAVSGARLPNLTHAEALLVVEKLVAEAETKRIPAGTLISQRLKVTQGRAHGLMGQARDMRKKKVA